MQALYGRPVFRVVDTLFYWEDVLLDAVARGRWTDFERTTEEGLACVAHAEATGTAEPEEEIEEAAREFRYERELITALEMEQWLSARGLTAQEWMEHMRRGVLRSHASDRLENLLLRHPTQSGDEFDAALRVDLICSGIGWEFAEELAERAAAARSLGEAELPSVETAELPALPPGLSVERAVERWPVLQRIERAMERFRTSTLTQVAIQKEIRANQMDWMRVDCRSAVFPDEAQAREAALCVREDGLSLDEVAATARVAIVESRCYLDELEPDLRAVFLASRQRELLGPISADGEFTLYQILGKEIPTEQDTAIVERAEASLLRRALADEARRHVSWDVAP